jgi:hypothetical protein
MNFVNALVLVPLLTSLSVNFQVSFFHLPSGLSKLFAVAAVLISV